LEGLHPAVEALGSLAPFLVVLVAFYLLVIRPARTRQRQQQSLQASLAPGQKVMTTSGLIATISAVEDDAVLLEAAPGVVLRWAKPAIGRVLTTEDGADESSGVDERGAISDDPVARAE
jgi:preprotein translocase subunit YajC